MHVFISILRLPWENNAIFTSTLVLPHWQNQFWNRRPIMYLVSPTGEEKEKQSKKRRKKKNKQCWIMCLVINIHLYSLTNKTNSELEGQSCTWFHQLVRRNRNKAWRGRRRRINSAKAILLKPEASVEVIQGLRQQIPYMWDDPPGSPSTSVVSLN